MTPDEYERAKAELDQEVIDAKQAFEAETERAYQTLKEAEARFIKVVEPAQQRYDTKIVEIEKRKQDAFGDMWDTHLEGQRAHNLFVLDLLSEPDKIEEKLRAKVSEEA